MTKVKCMICGREYKWLPTHIKTHGMNVEKYCNRFPGAKIMIDELNHKGKNNPAYGKPAWNKGLTKETDKRVENYSGERPGSRPDLKERQTGKTWEEIWGTEKGSEMRKKESEKKKQKYASGETIVWNLGLTKETDETLMKISEESKGRVFTEEHKKNMKGKRGPNEKLRGRIVSEETRKKISDSRIGTEGYWLGKHFSEAHITNISKSRKGKNGELASAWKGGLSFEPYCEKFDDDLKERVREYFGRCCYVCGKNEIENGERLSVHHVNYNKDTCCDDSKPLFIPLCHSCHSKTHGNREYWEEFFTISLKCLTKSKCFYTKEEMKKLISDIKGGDIQCAP